MLGETIKSLFFGAAFGFILMWYIILPKFDPEYKKVKKSKWVVLAACITGSILYSLISLSLK